MSGGAFDYKQYEFGYIADSIEQEIVNNGKKKEGKLESWESEYHNQYSLEVIEKFKEAVDCLRKAQIYTQRIDWLISGDDGEQSFLNRLNAELNG